MRATFAATFLLALSACDRQPPTPAPATAAAPRIDLPRWNSGQRYVYKASVSSRLFVPGQDLMAFELGAELQLEARINGADTQVAAWLSNASFKTGDPEIQAQFVQVAQELSEPFGFTMSEGKLREIRLRPGSSRFTSSIARTLAAAFQFAEPPKKQGGPTWTAEEVDGTGKYETEYALGGPGTSDVVVSKRKLRYQPVALGKVPLGNFNAKITPEVVQSSGKMGLRTSGGSTTLELVEYTEKLKTALTPTAQLDSQTTLRLGMTRTETAEKPLDWAGLQVATQPLVPDAPYGEGAPRASYDAERIGDYTFEKAVADLEEQARDPKRNDLFQAVRDQSVDPELVRERQGRLEGQSRAFGALAALFRKDPKNIPLAVARIHKHSPALRGLLDALSSAGSAEAQRALVGLMHDPKSEISLRRAAAFSLTRTEHATIETVAALQRHFSNSDPLQEHALLGLGTIARRLNEGGEVSRADTIVDGFVERLKAAKTPKEQALVLRAIANSGGARALPAVRPLLNATTPNVRAAAVDALRLMAHPDVDGIVAEHLKDEEPSVQGAALSAISVREPSDVLARALETVASSAQRSTTRIQAIKIMGRWIEKRPELRASLERLAQTDGPGPVKEAARKALGS